MRAFVGFIGSILVIFSWELPSFTEMSYVLLLLVSFQKLCGLKSFITVGSFHSKADIGSNVVLVHVRAAVWRHQYFLVVTSSFQDSPSVTTATPFLSLNLSFLAFFELSYKLGTGCTKIAGDKLSLL